MFSSTHWLGIPVALLGAVFLALGTIYQARGVGSGANRDTGFAVLVCPPVWLPHEGAIVEQLAARHPW